jgi:hypothetical protein
MMAACRAAWLTAVFGTAALAAPPAILSVRRAVTEGGPRTVARYEKLELRADIQAEFDNPYDPDDVDIQAEFTAPSGRLWKIWGFYNPASWNALWVVRFAPSEIGTWRYILRARDRNGTAESKPGQVTVVDGPGHGFVRIAGNRRYFAYSDGAPFYPVGLWYNDNFDGPAGTITEAGLDALQQHGANFVSFYSSPLETMGTGLGRYDQGRAARLDTIFDWCEKRQMLVSWNIWFHSYFSEEVWGGGSARYRYNPYRLVASADRYFSSLEAWKYHEKLLRYMVARWGYSRSLFLWFVVDEINGTEGWQKGGSEAAEAWCRRVHEWLKANDPYGRPTTGTQSGGLKQWWPGGYAIFDVAAREIYEAQGHPMPDGADHPLQVSYRNYAKQTQDLWSGFAKPAIIGECGYDHTWYEPGTPGYLAMYHNALWAGLANGLAASPFWWSNGPMTGDSVVTRSMTNFAQFVRSIRFSDGDWKPAGIRLPHGDGWAMSGDTITFGWVVNPAGGVAGETFTVAGLPDGDYDVYLYRTWRGQYLEPVPASAAAGTLTITVPELKAEGGHAQQMGDDVAFQIVRHGTILP